MVGALGEASVDVALRITGDDILIDPDYVDYAIKHHLGSHAEYSDLKALPKGADLELFDAQLLRRLWTAASKPEGTEYLTLYLTAQQDQFRTSHIPPAQEHHARPWRLTLDTPEDHEVIRTFLEAMKQQGKGLTYRMDDLVNFFQDHEELLQKNAHITQRAVPPEVCVELNWRRWS